MRPAKHSLLKLIFPASMTLVSLPSFAQDPASGGPALEEIIVTAQKREQNLQDVPLAVSAVTADQLDSAGVRSMETLSQTIPGLVINNASTLLLPFIRGVGAFNAGAATSSSVAVYVDGVYTPRSSALAFSLDNVQQVEVLKGPQSTLYGRNATGGAITVTTATPSPGDDVTGKISLTYGNYDQRRLSGTIAGGFGSTFAGSLTGSIVQRDGYVDNLATQTFFGGGSTIDDVNSEDEQIINAKLAYEPTADSEFVLSATYRRADDTSNFGYRQFDGANFLNGLAAGGLLPQAMADALIAALPREKYQTYTWWGYREARDITASLSAKIDFDGMYLVSITGYLDNELVGKAETYGLPIAFAGFAPDWGTKSLSQEVRLHSDDDGKLKWLAGAQYFSEKDPASEIYGTLGPALSGSPTGLLTVSPQDPLADTNWKSTSYAGFGEVVYAATDAISITAGVRNTWEKFQLHDNRDPAVFGAAVIPDREEDWSELTYRLVADWNFDAGMVYASRSRGFVSGTLNVQNPSGAVVEPETLDANEIGFKSDWGGRVRLNTAVFDYSYKNIHAQTVNGTTGLTNLVAGQKATIRGADVEMDAALSDGFTVKAGLTYLFDREYDKFSVPASGVAGTPSFFPAVEATGNTIAGAPELTALLGLDHSVRVGSGRIETNVNVSYNSGVFFDTAESVGSSGAGDDGYTVANFRTTYYSPSERWSVSLWVNNAFEEYYMSGGINSSGSIVAIEALPRFYGATFTYKID